MRKQRHIPLNRAEPATEQTAGAKLVSFPSPTLPTIKLDPRQEQTHSAPRKSRKSPGTDGHKRVPVPTKHNDNEQRRDTKNRAGAIKRLGLDPGQVRNLPSITHLLEHADGGIPAVITALRLANHPDADRFLEKWDDVSDSDRKWITIEQVSVAAGITPKRLLELSVSALVEDSQSLAQIISATYHPRVIQATAECAYLFPDNQSDRKLFLAGTGFLPRPGKGGGGVFVQNTINLPPVPETGGEDAPEITGPTFNAAEDDLIKLHTMIDGEHLLNAPKTIENASQIQIGHVYKPDAEGELDCIPHKKS